VTKVSTVTLFVPGKMLIGVTLHMGIASFLRRTGAVNAIVGLEKGSEAIRKQKDGFRINVLSDPFSKTFF